MYPNLMLREPEYLIFHMKYTKEKQNPQEIEVSLKHNSVVFCEVKSSFPNITCGSEKYHKLEISKKKEKFNNSNYEFTYIDQIDNLIKKAKLFFNLFIDEDIINEEYFFHILYLYDEEDINLLKPDFKIIKNKITVFLNKQFFPKKMKNTIFQVVYLDKEKNEQRIQNNYENKIKKERKKNQIYENKIKYEKEKNQIYENKIKELEKKLKGCNPNYN